MVTKTYLFANLKGISFYSSSVLWYKRYEYTAIYYTLYIDPNINTQHLSLSTNQSKALESQMLKIVCLTLHAKVNKAFYFERTKLCFWSILLRQSFPSNLLHWKAPLGDGWMGSGALASPWRFLTVSPILPAGLSSRDVQRNLSVSEATV